MNGMADNDESENFFDEDFPDIPDDELDRLDQDAISFTQREGQHSNPQQNGWVQKVQPAFHLQKSHAPAVNTTYGQSHGGHQHVDRPNGYADNQQQDSSYGTFLDEEGLPMVIEEQPQLVRPRIPDETTEREQWRLNRFAQPPIQNTKSQYNPQPTRGVASRPFQAGPQIGRPNTTSQPRSYNDLGTGVAQRSAEEDALRTRIAGLMRERDELTTSLNQTKQEVFIKNGEISIVRSKQSQAEKAHQRQLDAVQKSKQEEIEKHSATLQAINAENVKIASEVQFLKQELKEESRKAQTYQRQLRDRPLSDKPHNVNTTPKRHHALRDGFDEDEMMVISPVKSGRRSKQGTPTANRKRKQPTENSLHIQPLPLRLSGAAVQTEAPPKSNKAPNDVADHIVTIVQKHRLAERHLRLIQSVTNFRPKDSQEVLIERLFSLTFPSDPKKSLGTITVEAIAKLQGPRIAGDLFHVFIDLWSRAIREGYTSCLSLLIGGMGFILDRDPLVIDIVLLDTFLPLLQSTITVNGSAHFGLSKKEWLTDPSKSKPKLDLDIDNTACMELFQTLAYLASDDVELISRLWRQMATDFVLMMLNACQPIPDIILMLQSLSTSILPDTFAMICEATQQARFETYIVDRVCWLLWDFFKPDADASRPSYPFSQILNLRQEALNLLAKFTFGSSPNAFDPSVASNHGTVFLANHPNAIGRITRCIYDELALAYHLSATQAQHIQLVNTGMRILHFIHFSPAGRLVNWQEKINAAKGGSQKFCVAMARLAYADGAVSPGIDSGVTEDTVRMAMELLEQSVTPDEAEDLLRVFEGDGVSGSGSTAASRRTSGMGSTQKS